MSLLGRIAELEQQGAEAAVVTVVRTSGSTPRSLGAKMIVHGDGRIEGTIGGGQLEYRAIELALETLEGGSAQYAELELTKELGMCCGGTASLFIEPLVTHPHLIVFGAGHVGEALARSATAAGFRVTAVDERESILREANLPANCARVDLLDDPELPFGDGTFVMIATHDHALDQRLVERCLRQPVRWLGVIGSRRKAELMRQRLNHRGFEDRDVSRVRCPVGLAIGAETAEEIAVAIVAELIAVRRAALTSPTSPQLETKVRGA